MTLRELKIGEHAAIKRIHGGRGMFSKLESLGLREGVRIVKKSALMARGPVIVEVGATQIAIGSEMAARILVEPVERACRK